MTEKLRGSMDPGLGEPKKTWDQTFQMPAEYVYKLFENHLRNTLPADEAELLVAHHRELVAARALLKPLQASDFDLDGDGV